MISTWLNHFLAENDISKYPVALRTRGGISFRIGKRETQSFFVGHPIHYFEGGLWKPITLEFVDGQFIGLPFAWIDDAVYYKGKPIAKPESVALDGKIYPLSFLRDGLEYKADTPIGRYVIRFYEGGVKTEFTLHDELENAVERIIFKSQRYKHGLIENHGRPEVEPGKKNPKILDPGTDYADSTADGYVRGQNAVYATARTTSTLYVTNETSSSLCATLTGGVYYCFRHYYKFDTSAIPDTDVISQVNLRLVATADNSLTDFDVDIVKADWSSYDPLSSGNQEAAYDLGLSESLDDSIWRNTSGMSINTQYSSGNLDTAWPSKTGNTYYMAMSSWDRDNTTPTDYSYIQIAMQDNAVAAYRPVLVVIHAAPTANTAGRVMMWS